MLPMRSLCLPHLPRRLQLLVASLFLALLAGPLISTARADNPPEPVEIQIVHVPGIIGPTRMDRAFLETLRQSLSSPADPASVADGQIFNWVGNRRGIPALQGIDENRRQARQLAQLLIDLRHEHPNAKLVLTAHSGGTGIAVWALELLPELAARHGAGEQGDAQPVQVDVLLLLASALSPDYDLSPALASVAGQAATFSSTIDAAILGVGTRTYGTIDGKFVNSGGMVGFLLPDAADKTLYARLAEIPYDVAFARYGHWGHHTGMMRPSFVAGVIVPLLRTYLDLLDETLLEESGLPTTRPILPMPLDQETAGGPAPTKQPATRPTTRVAA